MMTYHNILISTLISSDLDFRLVLLYYYHRLYLYMNFSHNNYVLYIGITS